MTPLPVEPAGITVGLVEQLVLAQFPEWARLPVSAVGPGGWDNRMFRLGEDLSVRLPSAAAMFLRSDASSAGFRSWPRGFRSRSPCPSRWGARSLATLGTGRFVAG